MSKTNKIGVKKIVIAIIITLVPIATVSGFLIIEHSKAKNGENSLIFTSKKSFEYPDPVIFNEFEISSTGGYKSPEEPDTKLATIDCYKLPVRNFADPLDNGTTDFEKGLLTSKYRYKYLAECLNAKADDETPRIWLEFRVKNLSNEVSSLTPYKFSVIGDPSIEEVGREVNSGDFAPSEERDFRIGFEYNRHFEGNFRLLIVNEGKSKNQEFSWPLE